MDNISCVQIIDRERVRESGIAFWDLRAHWINSHFERCPICGEIVSLLTNGEGFSPLCSGEMSQTCTGPDVPGWAWFPTRKLAWQMWDNCCRRKRIEMLLVGETPADPFDYETVWANKKRRRKRVEGHSEI